jgi:alkylated DNA repair dioxygenase AlkB
MSEVQWEHKAIKMFGKEVMQPRLTAWYGSEPYTYSGVRNAPAQPTKSLKGLMNHIEALIDAPVNSVLCNLYRNGQDSVGKHSDNEPELGPSPLIVSLSLGATRTFKVQPKPKSDGLKLGLSLNAGDLLVMYGRTQETHEHWVPKEPKVTEARINLTFRNILKWVPFLR